MRPFVIWCQGVEQELENFLNDLKSGDEALAEAAAQSLARLGAGQEGEVLPFLEEMLASGDADLRWWAVRTLSGLNSPQIGARLIKALGDREAAVRQCAALGLRLHPDVQAVEGLIHALEDQDSLVRALAAEALVAIGEAAVPALLEALRSGSHRVRLGAVRALANIGDERAIPALYLALDEDSALMEYWASEGLERMGVGMVFFRPEG